MIDIATGRVIIDALIVTNGKHQDYDRTVDRKNLYYAMQTGQDLVDRLKIFLPRETQDQFDARKTITNQCVSPAINEALSTFYKAGRYPNVKNDTFYESGTERLPRLEKALRYFCDEGDVQEYLLNHYDLRSLLDPNAFLVIDFKAFNASAGEVPQCYGVYIGCENVRDFSYMENDTLDYLVIDRVSTIYDADRLNKATVTDFIGYLGNDILLYEEAHEWRAVTPGSTRIVEGKGDHKYYEYQINSKAGQVQAIRLGYKKDPLTNWRTCVSPLDNAENAVIDLNADKSEYDVVKKFHIFPRKWQYGLPCPGEAPQDLVYCRGGERSTDGKTCKKCGGSGFKILTNSSDVMLVPFPDDIKGEGMVTLKDMTHYEVSDIDIIKHMREDVQAGKIDIIRSIFTTESVVRTDGNVKIEKTATEVDLKDDDKNNVVLPFCKYRSRVFKFIVRQVAEFNDLGEGLQVLFEYPPSMRLEDVETLQLRFTALSEAGASAMLLNDLEDEIATKRFVDDQESLKRYYTWSLHRPFRNRPETEIEFMIGQGGVPKWRVVLWANYEEIMNDLALENKGFFDTDPKTQREMIKAKAIELEAELPKPEIEGFAKNTGARQEELAA